MAKEKWYQFKKVDAIFGIPVKFFVPVALIIIAAGRLGWVPSDLFITAFALVMAVGGILSWIGEVTPILKSIGGKLLLPLLGASMLVKKGVLSEIFSTSADLFTQNGFQMFFVAAVVAGAILATDSRFLKACVIRYIPVLLISQVFAIGFSFLAAKLTGRSVYEAIFFVAAPCMTGGTSGAISTLPALYSSVLGADMTGMAAQLYAVALLGTYLSLIMAIIMNILAKKFPKAMGNGNGEILRNESPALQEAKKTAVVYEQSSSDYGDLMGGVFIACAFMVLGSIFNHFISAIVYIAWTLIIIVILKIFNLVPDKFCRQAYYFSNMSQKYVVIILTTCIGMGSSSGGGMSSALQLSNVVIIVLAILGAVVGAGVGAKLFGLYRYESSLTAAICACNIGASGDVQTCYVCDRMELLPYATISTRIGGAMMLVEISILFPIVARAAGIIA
ncbi:2-hydroxycarboxylate transporter family protein [Oscillibacter sp. MSJ-2]|uniref:2-hydroxycarboxylate transporter family protein n=1 Tax=Dysosmobacter acutus TaxID=2841504 RepID=A0ABS6F9Q1_9FIRM|nr:2-hydroxycarboxylate transporter family protein [Dysosmobacter acutus]MBU5627021.1 2-hydroxycarboxylate transporter family protein [Dysosmobacter acutus]